MGGNIFSINNNMSTEYAKFLDGIRKRKKYNDQDNFFSITSIESLENALNAELKYMRGNKIPTSDENTSNNDTQFTFFNTRRGKQLGVRGLAIKNNEDYDKLLEYRKNNGKKEASSFMQFANESIRSIKEYQEKLGKLKDSEESVARDDEFRKCCKDFKNSLLSYLKTYRKESSKYHIFGKSEGRAEIANLFMGGSLQHWINKSFDVLCTTGTKFDTLDGGKYEYKKKSILKKQKRNDQFTNDN